MTSTNTGTTSDAVGVGTEGPCPECGHDVAADEASCPECGTARDDGTDRVEITLDGLAGVSDRGHLHSRNEDAMALGERAGVRAAVVCDGVSSVEHPEVASRTVTAATLAALLTERPADRPAEEHLRLAVAEAARALTLLPRTHAPGRAPSCTLVSALVEDVPDGTDVTIGWIGDSRAYWLAGPESSQVLTTDHSWVVEIVATGQMDEAEAAADHRAHAITRWMGADSSDEPSVVTFAPAGPGLLLLCSDGLWNYLPEAADLAAAAVAAGDDPAAIADELTEYALDAGGRDNITVVVIPVVTA